jgi:hypothetical protein
MDWVFKGLIELTKRKHKTHVDFVDYDKEGSVSSTECEISPRIYVKIVTCIKRNSYCMPLVML